MRLVIGKAHGDHSVNHNRKINVIKKKREGRVFVLLHTYSYTGGVTHVDQLQRNDRIELFRVSHGMVWY